MSSSIAETLIRYGDLPVPVQQHLAGQAPFCAALATNPYLDAPLWYELYGPRVAAPAAQRLCWRPLSDEQVHHVLLTRGERRWRVLSALAVMRPDQVEMLLGELLSVERPDPATIDAAATLDVHPDRVAQVGHRGSLAAIGPWLFRHHHRLDDQRVAQILCQARWTAAQLPRLQWPPLIALLCDRRGVRELLTTDGAGSPALVCALGHAGLGADQERFVHTVAVRAAGDGDERERWWLRRALTAVRLHPSTRADTLRCWRAGGWCLGESPMVGEYGWGSDPDTDADPDHHEQLLNPDPYRPGRVWHLARLSANPHLGSQVRGRLATELSRSRNQLGACAGAALLRTQRDPRLPLLANRDRASARLSSRRALLHRLGPPAGGQQALACGADAAATLRLAGCGGTAAALAVMVLRDRLGDQVRRWEVALQLADELDPGTQVGELADTVLALLS